MSASKVVVIGAGPYGLATAAHLAALGVDARVFGDVMESWREGMPVGMFLKSTPAASNIGAPKPGYALSDFCLASARGPLRGHQPVPLETFADYGRWFQARLVPHVEGRRVVQVARSSNGFAVTLDDGEEIATPVVIAATGLRSYAHIPPELAGIASEGPSREGPVSHSGQFADLSGFAGRDVAVIGAGQSALETAALLHESGARPEVLVRGHRVIFAAPPANVEEQGLGTLRAPESTIGPGWSNVFFSRAPSLFRRIPLDRRLWLVAHALGPSGAWWLRSRVDGAVPVLLGQRPVGGAVAAGRVTLRLETDEGPRERSYDHVIAATGYRVALDTLDYLAPELRGTLARSGGSPKLGPFFESHVSGLFFPGIAAAATFGPLMRFVCGTSFAARRVSRAVAAR